MIDQTGSLLYRYPNHSSSDFYAHPQSAKDAREFMLRNDPAAEGHTK